MNMITQFIDRADPRRLFGHDSEDGQAIVEYSLIFVLIIVVCFSIVTSLGGTIDEKFFQVVKNLP